MERGGTGAWTWNVKCEPCCVMSDMWGVRWDVGNVMRDARCVMREKG